MEIHSDPTEQKEKLFQKVSLLELLPWVLVVEPRRTDCCGH